MVNAQSLCGRSCRYQTFIPLCNNFLIIGWTLLRLCSKANTICLRNGNSLSLALLYEFPFCLSNI